MSYDGLILSIDTHTHYTLFLYTSFCHLHPQIAKARRGRRRGKVTAVIIDNNVFWRNTDEIFFRHCNVHLYDVLLHC